MKGTWLPWFFWGVIVPRRPYMRFWGLLWGPLALGYWQGSRQVAVSATCVHTNKVMLIDRNTLIGTGYSWCKNCGALQNRNTNAVWQSPVGFEK